MPEESPQPVKALELFCGIGGFAAAIEDRAQITGAIDLGAHVLSVYRHNFPHHNPRQAHLEHIAEQELANFEADLWWMSPPCQPYTTRGKERDLDDRRAKSLVRMIEVIDRLRPDFVGMENVEGFFDSDAHKLVTTTLHSAGYEFYECLLCPTELGVPARRVRYYLVASRKGLRNPPAPAVTPRKLASYIDESIDESLIVPQEIVDTHGPGMRILDLARNPDTIANTFTGAYGKTWQAAGSYLRLPDGRVRRFSPRELLRLLDFPEDFSFPSEMSRRQVYKCIGNSLSVVAMRHVLARLPLNPQSETR